MKSFVLKTAVTAVLMGMTAVAFGVPPDGKGPGTGGGPPDGKGNRPDTEVGNNLSVPAILLGGATFEGVACGESWSDLTIPNKDPVFYPYAEAETHDGLVTVDEGFYYKQRDAAWQAPCMTAASASALGKWGDNIAGGDASLKVGSPIRVELVLWESAGAADTQQGYYVIKLEPAELDRLADYGHLAEGEEDAWNPIPISVGDPLFEGSEDFMGAVVHDGQATLRIEQMVDGVPVTPAVYDGDAGAEINATGKIVYGHNLRVGEAGTYRITYTLPNLSQLVCDPRAFCDGNSTWLDIEVIAGGGGGGGKKDR